MEISPTKTNAYGPIGERIRKIRQQNGLTQEALAGSEFTKGYISALERGAVRPSLKALDVFARRLGVPITDFLSASQEQSDDSGFDAQQEEFLSRCNYVKMLMRVGQLNKALQLIDELERHIESSANIFPPSLSYMVSFLRGIAHLQSGAPKVARTELEAALANIREDEEATVRVRNFLGIAFLMLDLPQHAVEQHLVCWQSIRNLVTKDPNLYVSVCRNLANDYSALNEPDRAIDLYEEILPAMQDLNDLEQQAEALSKIAMAYEAKKDWPRAKQYGSWALRIYEAADSRAEAGYFCLKLAKIHTGREQYGDALELLKRAERLVMGTGNHAVMSYLHRAYADLARRQGDYESGIQHAKQSITLAQAYKEATQSGDSRANALSWQDPTSLYAEALHIEALIEEDKGNKEAADRLFEQALDLLHTGGFEEVRHAINLSYAIVLQARGDLEKAVSFYRRAAELQTLAMPRPI